jgi:hypothetical protein
MLNWLHCIVYSVEYNGHCLLLIVCSILGSVYSVWCTIYWVLCIVSSDGRNCRYDCCLIQCFVIFY